MKDKQFAFDLKSCRNQLEQYKQYLDEKNILNERTDVLNKFRDDYPHLLASIASFHPKVCRFNRLATEYDINGYFVADLVVGDFENNAYCFVEFEGAFQNSVFTKFNQKGEPLEKRREIPHFDHKFLKGLSQLIDWFWALDESVNDARFLDRFGNRNFINYMGVLVIGRDKHLDDQDKRRLAWLQEKLFVSSRKIICLTFDQLYRDLRDRLNLYQVEEKVSVNEIGLPIDSDSPPISL